MNAVVNHQVSDMERMARAIAGSRLFGIQNPEQALALCLVAQAEGRHPATAAQDYHILQGRPAKKADAMLRDFLGAGGKVQWHQLDDTIADATFTHPAGGSARIDWTLDRAKRAGLTTPMWSKYPRQMLRARCVSEGVRTVFPMATSGMYVPEEVQDIVAEENAPTETRSEPTSLPATSGIKRLTSARAKELGKDKDFRTLVDACESVEALDALERNFDRLTAEHPLSWLDAMRNELILHREELTRDTSGDDELDAEFKAVVGAA